MHLHFDVLKILLNVAKDSFVRAQKVSMTSVPEIMHIIYHVHMVFFTFMATWFTILGQMLIHDYITMLWSIDIVPW